MVRGEDLRDVLGQSFGGRSIKSTRFSIEHTAGTFVFDGKGFGHGVGLCQAGALARIRAGAKLPAVLGDFTFPARNWSRCDEATSQRS